MPNEQIVVREIIAPKPGGKQYAIIDTSGQRWGVYPDKIGEFTIGGIYNVLEAKENVFQGKTYITLSQAEYVGMDGGAASAPTPARATAAPRSYVQRAAPAPRPNGAYGAVARTRPPGFDADRRLDIFVCGAFNNVMSNPNIMPSSLSTAEIIEIIQRLTTAWRQTLGNERSGQVPDEELPI